MTIRTMIAGGIGLAALAAAPAAAQYGYPYQNNPPNYPTYGSPYGYANPYGQAYGYQAQATQMATQRCAAAVQSRLSTNTSTGGILGALLGVRTQTQGRVLSVTQVTPNRSTIRVRGTATSGRAAYNPYGYGAYGATGYSYQPDLTYKCDIDYRGQIRDVDITRR